MDEIDHRLSELFKVLGNGIRLQILLKLLDRRQSVKRLTRELDRSQQSVSRHLSILRNQDLVQAETQGQYRIYELKRTKLVEKCLELRPHLKRRED